jgi:hypothetical protein
LGKIFIRSRLAEPFSAFLQEGVALKNRVSTYTQPSRVFAPTRVAEVRLLNAEITHVITDRASNSEIQVQYAEKLGAHDVPVVQIEIGELKLEILLTELEATHLGFTYSGVVPQGTTFAQVEGLFTGKNGGQLILAP